MARHSRGNPGVRSSFVMGAFGVRYYVKLQRSSGLEASRLPWMLWWHHPNPEDQKTHVPRKDAKIAKGTTQVWFCFSWRSSRLGERKSRFRPKAARVYRGSSAAGQRLPALLTAEGGCPTCLVRVVRVVRGEKAVASSRFVLCLLSSALGG